VRVFRCSQCRVIVDVARTSSLYCTSCGGALTLSESATTATVWDDDEPTARVPARDAAKLAEQGR
jgi:hypothetical protein